MLPTKIRKKGRPKGREFSIVGLPYKKKMPPMKEKILPFKMYPFKRRQHQILTWIVGKSRATRVLSSCEKIGVDEIPKTNFLLNYLLDDNVDVSTVNDYLTKDSWNKLLKLVSQKKVGSCLSICVN